MFYQSNKYFVVRSEHKILSCPDNKIDINLSKRYGYQGEAVYVKRKLYKRLIGTEDDLCKQDRSASRRANPLKKDPPRIVPCVEIERDAISVLFLITLQKYINRRKEIK